jgi:hypothetical protein
MSLFGNSNGTDFVETWKKNNEPLANSFEALATSQLIDVCDMHISCQRLDNKALHHNFLTNQLSTN